ncbi:MAG: NAD-dependent epimerase/dehydratase family protein [Magnetococcales bacterium]|nr:NAD-dependent epimerase/dehydratase family protein [Magnetococcales bacterium]MBF0321685.1 NAD-dependent epimerase/dehydratase family protein [Magnetococcales bacterium]
MRVLVFGGNGFIGANLVQWLARDPKEKVRLFHRPGAFLGHLDGLDIERVAGELTNEAQLVAAMTGCDLVFNLAGCGSNAREHIRQRVEVNVEAAARVARVVRQAGLRLVHVSSIAAIGRPARGQIADESMAFNMESDHYALTKHQGETAVLQEHARGLDVVVASPGNVVGGFAMKAGQKSNFKAIASGRMLFYPPGGVCLTDIDDLVQGLWLCGERGKSGRRYILGGENVTFREYFREIALATRGKIPSIRLPATLLPMLGWGVETAFNVLGRNPPLTYEAADLIARFLYYSSRRAQEELGYAIGDWRQAVAKAAQAVS